MKIQVLCILFCLFIFESNVFAHNEWMSYQQPVVEMPNVPPVVYSTYPQPLVVTYNWVPYTIYRPVYIERQGIFCKYRTVFYETKIEWIYQPIIRQPY